MVKVDVKKDAANESQFHMCKLCYVNLDDMKARYMNSSSKKESSDGYCNCGCRIYKGDAKGQLYKWVQVAFIPKNCRDYEPDVHYEDMINGKLNLGEKPKDEIERHAWMTDFSNSQYEEIKVEDNDQYSVVYKKDKFIKNEGKIFKDSLLSNTNLIE